MQDKFILKSIADTFTGKAIHQFTIPIKVIEKPAIPKRTMTDRILRRPTPTPAEPETVRIYEIRPCVVANMYRIAGQAALLPNELFTEKAPNIPFILEHMPTIVYIVAAAIQNNHLEPDPELITFLENNVDAEDMYTALKAAFSSLRIDSFTNSIALMKGTVGILDPMASPKDGSELIASHTAV